MTLQRILSGNFAYNLKKGRQENNDTKEIKEMKKEGEE
jgi:hypothetical protein